MACIHARGSRFAIFIAARLAKSHEAFERKLGVDHQRPFIAGQANDAIGPHATAERGLEFIGALWQAIFHDRFHPALAESAARLLVRQNVFQRQHFARQRVEIFLCLIDQCEPLIELCEIFERACRILFQPIAKPGIEAVDPFSQKPSEIGLTAFERLADLRDATAHLRLRLQKHRHLVVEFALPFRRRGRLFGQMRPCPRATQKRDHQQE